MLNELVGNIYREVLQAELACKIAKEKLKSRRYSGEEEIFVTPDKVIFVFNKYLSGELNQEELSDWASFLLVEDVYVVPNWEDDEQADKYEPMWYILQQLSCPVIDGEITHKKVKEYIKELELLKQQLSL